LSARRRKFSGEFPVDRLVAHRWSDDGFDFRVRWAPKPRGGLWDDSWEPLKFVSGDLVDSYFSTTIALHEIKQVW
jgi:hypothetical protein